MIKNDLIEHHVKYKEIHGIDETVWMTRSEHGKLHRRLRQTGKCNIPVEELKIISIKAGNRTDKKKEQDKLNKQTQQHKVYRKQYNKNIVKKFTSRETITPNISLSEEIVYNKNTGNVFVTSGFVGTNGMKLIRKEI